MAHDHNAPGHKEQMRANIEAARQDPRVVRAFGAVGWVCGLMGFSKNSMQAAAEIMLSHIAHETIDPRAIDFLENVALLAIDTYPDHFAEHIVRLMDGIKEAKVTVTKVYEEPTMPPTNPDYANPDYAVVEEDEDDEDEHYTGEYGEDREDDDVQE